MKAYDVSYQNLDYKEEDKDKDKDNDKNNDKDKDAKNITETLILCYIFGILMTQAFQV